MMHMALHFGVFARSTWCSDVARCFTAGFWFGDFGDPRSETKSRRECCSMFCIIYIYINMYSIYISMVFGVSAFLVFLLSQGSQVPKNTVHGLHKTSLAWFASTSQEQLFRFGDQPVSCCTFSNHQRNLSSDEPEQKAAEAAPTWTSPKQKRGCSRVFFYFP